MSSRYRVGTRLARFVKALVRWNAGPQRRIAGALEKLTELYEADLNSRGIVLRESGLIDPVEICAMPSDTERAGRRLAWLMRKEQMGVGEMIPPDPDSDEAYGED